MKGTDHHAHYRAIAERAKAHPELKGGKDARRLNKRANRVERHTTRELCGWLVKLWRILGI